MAYANSGATTTPDDISVGISFRVIKAKTCTGIKVCWKIPSGTETTTVKLYAPGGGTLATATFLATTTKTIYDVIFSSAVDLTPYLGEYLVAAVYAPNNNLYIVDATAMAISGSTDVLVGDGTLYNDSVYASGNNKPDLHSSIYYPVDPILI